MERHVTTFGRLELQVTISNLVWQQSRQLKPSIKLSMLFLVNVQSIFDCTQEKHCVDTNKLIVVYKSGSTVSYP